MIFSTIHKNARWFKDISDIVRVTETKLLGIIVQNDLRWDGQVTSVISKCNTRIYFLKQLRRSGLDENALRHYYCSVIRSVVEYACPLWFTGLTLEQQQSIERIQRRAIGSILPGLPYEHALNLLSIPRLSDRLTDICKRYYQKIKKNEHRLNHLLTPAPAHQYQLRNKFKYALPKVKTERSKKFIINYGAFNHW